MVVTMPKAIITMIVTKPSNERSNNAVPMSASTNPERQGRLHAVLHRRIDGTVEDDVARHMIVQFGIARPSPFQDTAQVVRHLTDHRALVLGLDEADRQRAHAPVAGDQTPDKLGLAPRYLFNSCKIALAQGCRPLDKWLDDEIIALRTGVVVVRKGVDTAGMRRLPCGLGQLLDRAERAAR